VGGVKILFAGSPEVALPALEVVAAIASELAVMSQPDKPVGRKKIFTPTAVSMWALHRDVTLYRPSDHESIARAVSEFSPDLGITVAYGRLLRADVLDIPTHGWWNLHFSLLPRWRGAAPVQNALLAGDTDTGVSVFQLDEGMDTGPLLSQRAHSITPGITAGALLGELSVTGAALLADTVRSVVDGQHTLSAQQGDASYAPKLDRETGRIRASDSLVMASRRFQATTPEPGCFVSVGQGSQTIRILSATANTDPTRRGDGSIRLVAEGVGIDLDGGLLLLETVQPAGKTAMGAADWWRGVHGEIVIDA
jgi:methionyl-tRNA formyltransferase